MEANYNVCGELKLGGRPLVVPIDGHEDDAEELGQLGKEGCIYIHTNTYKYIHIFTYI